MLFRKTSMSLMTSYLVIIVSVLRAAGGPLLCRGVLSRSTPPRRTWSGRESPAPFAATFAIPLDIELVRVDADEEVSGKLAAGAGLLVLLDVLNGTLLVSMIWLFQRPLARGRYVAAFEQSPGTAIVAVTALRASAGQLGWAVPCNSPRRPSLLRRSD